MASYGQILDPDYDPRKDDVYTLFTVYFGNPEMTKIKDVGQYSMYTAKIHALLGIEYRYVIVFVYRDESKLGTVEKLNVLKWISLQTRGLPDDHKIPYHSYVPRRMPELDKKISLKSKAETSDGMEQYIYTVQDLPITITLLAKKNASYNASGTVVLALETYSTIVSF